MRMIYNFPKMAGVIPEVENDGAKIIQMSVATVH